MALTGRALSIQRNRERRARQSARRRSELTQPAPQPMVLGASTTGLNAAQLGGAAGLGFEDYETQRETSGQVRENLNTGAPRSTTGDSLSRDQANSLVRTSGLDGLIDGSKFAGMSRGAAAQAIAAERAKRTGQISANTSFTFNPETLKRTQRAVDGFNFALDETLNDPFEHKNSKRDKQRSILDATSKTIGQLFSSPDELFTAYQTNPQFQATLNQFIQKGGTVDGIARNITGPVAAGNVQDTGSYLASLTNPTANQEAEQAALDELLPERAVAQEEIMRQARIPSELKDLYFGSEERVGLLEMKRMQAEEEVKILEERERDEKRTAREKAELLIDKNRAELKIEKSKIEENRLAAKNYMTGMLAKLGALITTGAAPQALQTLETKYQMQTQTLENQYKFASQEIEINLNATLDEIENGTSDSILKIQEDLTKNSETVAKEILKAQQAAEKEVYRVSEQYTRRLRERTAKYTSDLKKEAEKYAKEFAKQAAGGFDLNKMAEEFSNYDEGEYVPKKGVLLPTGEVARLSLTPTQEREVKSARLRGLDTMQFFLALEPEFKKLVIQQAARSKTNYSLNQLLPLYDNWTAAQERAGEGTKTTNTDDDEEFSGF